MKFFNVLLIVVMMGFVFTSCSLSTGDMSPETFLKIEDEVIRTDMTPEAKAKVAKKFGHTLEQLQKFEERARTDKKLQEQLGALRLKKK